MIEMIKNTMVQIIASYTQYAGIGMYMMLFFISLVFINIWENRSNTRIIRHRRSENNIILFQYPLVALAVIFNPLIVVGLIALIGPEVYWRIFWILPVTICIAYAATVTILMISEKSRKILVTVALLLILIMCGRFIYSGTNYYISSNYYKLPEQTIEICSELEKDADGGLIRAAFAPELAITVRQYDANILMPYGRGSTSNSYVENVPAVHLYNVMQESTLNVKETRNAMKLLECNYLVLNKSTTLSNDLENYGFKWVASTESYNIYRFKDDGIASVE